MGASFQKLRPCLPLCQRQWYCKRRLRAYRAVLAAPQMQWQQFPQRKRITGEISQNSEALGTDWPQPAKATSPGQTCRLHTVEEDSILYDKRLGSKKQEKNIAWRPFSERRAYSNTRKPPFTKSKRGGGAIDLCEEGGMV